MLFVSTYASSAFAVVENKKWIDAHTSPYYDDGTYSGWLSEYVYSGYYTPAQSKTVYNTLPGEARVYYKCDEVTGSWVFDGDGWSTNQPYELPYSDHEGYSGTLYRYSTTEDYVAPYPTGACSPGQTHTQRKYYTAYYSGVVTKPAVDTRVYRYRGYAYAVVSDPSGSHYAGGNSGGANGEFTWKLEKTSDTSESQIRLINNAWITGNHYATRNPRYSIQSSGVVSQTSSSPINTVVNNPNDLKGKDITFSFSYEYTNYYEDIYYCSERNNKGCISWSFSHRIPDWSRAETATWNQTLKADHQYKETIDVSGDTTKQLIIGRTAKLNGKSISTNDLKEKFQIDASDTTLQSQNWIPINETLKYSSDLNNKLYVRDGEKWYFPYDMDDNLREKYKNKTNYALSNYAIPLRVGSQSNSSVTFNTADNFYLTENTGFQFSLPVNQMSQAVINQTAKKEYEAYTDETYDDQVLTTPSEGSRYYFNIDGNGEQKPNTWYNNHYVLGKLGLSEITFKLNEKVRFKQYLLGSPMDKPLVNEQQESVLRNVSYTHSIKLSPDQIKSIKELAKNRGDLLFGFRSTDIYEKYNQLQQILPSVSY